MINYKLVPVEPTPEMEQAGGAVYWENIEDVCGIYRAMLAAAPAAQGEPEGATHYRPSTGVFYHVMTGKTYAWRDAKMGWMPSPRQGIPDDCVRLAAVVQQPEPDVAELQKYKKLAEDIADLFHVGNEARTPSIILTNVKNAKASSDKYHSTPDVAGLVEALEYAIDTLDACDMNLFHNVIEVGSAALAAHRKGGE